MNTTAAPAEQRIALLGFGDFERSALLSYLRLTGTRVPAYVHAESVDDADFVIADTDHAGTLDTVLAAGRVADTVFVGSLAPDGALAWMMRPIDPFQVFRELDAIVAQRHERAQVAAAPRPSTPVAAQAAGAAAAAVPAPVERDPTRRAGDAIAPTAALLVDDSEVALRFLERQLQGLGLRTETATTSQRALEMLAQRDYDVVFLDVELGTLSDLDGLALCQHLKRQRRAAGGGTAPMVVMVSAHAAATDLVRGSFAGCDAYLAKPLDDDALRRSLRTLGLRLPTAGDGYVISRPGALHSRPLPLE